MWAAPQTCLLPCVMPDPQADFRSTLPAFVPKLSALESKGHEQWPEMPGWSDHATVSSPGDRETNFDDPPREDSLAPQTTEDFVGESLKRDLDVSTRHSLDFPIAAAATSSPSGPATNGFKGFHFINSPSAAHPDNDYAYVKLLLRSAIADKLFTLVQNHDQVRTLVKPCHLQLSSPNCFFPGTRDRVLSLRSRALCHSLAVVRFVAQLVSESAAGHGLSLREAKPELKIAVPRKVIGTIIGRGGSHIQQLRHNTMAHIHISPIFVPSEAACGERVISIVSRDHSSLYRAAEMVISRIHEHPDYASCRRVTYHSQNEPWRRPYYPAVNVPPPPPIAPPQPRLPETSSAESVSVAAHEGGGETTSSWIIRLFKDARFWHIAVWLYALTRLVLYLFRG
eukprot:Protomagalhaensia_wolfi_Nauph_80__569@NODE_1321_length_1589_cov_4_539355_g1021_i0_p1_GENE_NODE_1321_length_1589_cov_4_539355_g1021_i0NODE_1321_length_1589_cov_4_539355_g1021_i0_p1_ORF_typecomplete_len396_score19_97KH_1/PF00013_29/2_8e09KH_5/PF13184_6/0_045KH_2/PF07650_17/0_074_NODE_1321_length_1589_cov_4_539355_g1021_i0421229